MMALIIVLVVAIILFIVLLVISLIAHNKLFGKRFTKDPLVRYYSSSDFNINRRALEIKCGKNTLRGYDYNYDKYSKSPIVVFSHGMWCNVDAYNQDICTIARAGYEVIAINHTGVDTSDGKSILGLSGSLKALDSTISYIKSNPSLKDRAIYVVGHSWGGYATLNIPYFHKDISKLVAIAPFRSVNALLRGLLAKPLYILIPFIELIEKIKCGKHGLKRALVSLKGFKGSVLILHSKNDPMINYELNTGYLMKKDLKASFLINADRCHNPNYSKEAVDYMNEYLSTCKKLENEELVAYKRQADFKKMGELDNKVMAKIIEFLDK